MDPDFTRLKYENRLPLNEMALRLLWDVVWKLLFRPTPRWMLHGWRRGLLRLFGAKVGRGTRVDPTCRIWAPWNLEIGSYSALGAGVDCYCMDLVVIGSKVAVSQRSSICAGSHDTRSLKRPLITAPIVIGDHCWVAAECFILPGVKVGEGSVIAARSLVARDMPEWTICAGHPCKPIRPRILLAGEEVGAPV